LIERVIEIVRASAGLIVPDKRTVKLVSYGVTCPEIPNPAKTGSERKVLRTLPKLGAVGLLLGGLYNANFSWLKYGSL
jgi:hypothetical protein